MLWQYPASSHGRKQSRSPPSLQSLCGCQDGLDNANAKLKGIRAKVKELQDRVEALEESLMKATEDKNNAVAQAEKTQTKTKLANTTNPVWIIQIAAAAREREGEDAGDAGRCGPAGTGGGPPPPGRPPPPGPRGGGGGGGGGAAAGGGVRLGGGAGVAARDGGEHDAGGGGPARAAGGGRGGPEPGVRQARAVRAAQGGRQQARLHCHRVPARRGAGRPAGAPHQGRRRHRRPAVRAGGRRRDGRQPGEECMRPRREGRRTDGEKKR